MSRKSGIWLLMLLSFTWAVIAQPQPGTQLWAFDPGPRSEPVQSSPAIGLDGTIYFGVLGNLYAITNRGSNAWIFPTSGSSDSSPAIGVDGTIYYASSSGSLYAINTNGSKRWEYAAQCANGSPAIGQDNSIFIAGGPYLHAVSPSGVNIWKFLIGSSSVLGSPVLAKDGDTFIPSRGNNVTYYLSTNGVQVWSLPVNFTPGDSGTVGVDGTIYLPAGVFYAISTTGTNLWRNHTNSFLASSAAIGRDGTIYVAASGGSLYAFMPSGTLRWQALSGNQGLPGNTPAIDSSGMIYHAVSNVLYAISPSGAVQWTFSPEDYQNSATSPTIGSDGTIYVTFGTKLYALYGTNKLADSAWPMYRQNARHTGKVEKPSLQQPKKRADANFQFQLYAQIDQTQAVQTSTDLITWGPLTNVVVTNVPMDVVDLSASNFPTRFYRTQSQ